MEIFRLVCRVIIGQAERHRRESIWHALIETLIVRIGEDDKTVEVVAKVIEGTVQPGMNLEIQLNRSTNIAVPILYVRSSNAGMILLVLDGENSEGAMFIEAMNFADEIVVISSTD